jgi:hypothetical protein
MEKTKEQIIWESMWCQYHETNFCGCSQEQKKSDTLIEKLKLPKNKKG